MYICYIRFHSDADELSILSALAGWLRRPRLLAPVVAAGPRLFSAILLAGWATGWASLDGIIPADRSAGVGGEHAR